MKRKIDQDWNPEPFRLTIVAIINSMKSVFVDFGLEPPVNGDPNSVLMFLEMLHDLVLRREFGTTFLVAANRILDLIANTFDKRCGLSIGMETNNPMIPAHLIESLFTLRSFIDSHFFIDGSIIVRDFHLMNEDDLPIIFGDSAAHVAELKKKDIGAESIDDIDKNYILYGYFNIPMVGMFKGVLTRVHVTLPDEIMVKLRVGNKHNLNDKRFWFVNANGSGIFEKNIETSSPRESTDNNIEDVKFAPSRVLGDGNDFMGFLHRMNRTFVNEKGTYLKFEFTAFKRPVLLLGFLDNTVRYYDEDLVLFSPFKLVQFDASICETDIVQRGVSFPRKFTTECENYATWIVNEALGKDCAFTVNEFCFIGKIMKASGSFRQNALVNVFFEQSQHGENCYVDALATTFFVLKTEKMKSWKNDSRKAPHFVE